MKHLFGSIAIFLSLGVVFAMAQVAPIPLAVTALDLPASSNAGEIKGNIQTGQKIALQWAERSSVACFPATRFEMFNGNHVFYRVTLPAASAMKIILKPKNNKGLNLYALRQGVRGGQSVPPSAITCEASYPMYANLGGGKTVTNADDGTRKLQFISVRDPYSILIGVAGAKNLTEGDFTLRIEITAR